MDGRRRPSVRVWVESNHDSGLHWLVSWKNTVLNKQEKK